MSKAIRELRVNMYARTQWSFCRLQQTCHPVVTCFHSLYRLPAAASASQQFGSPLAPVVSQPAVLQPYGPPPTSTQVTAQLAGMQISGAASQAPPSSGLGYGK